MKKIEFDFYCPECGRGNYGWISETAHVRCMCGIWIKGNEYGEPTKCDN